MIAQSLKERLDRIKENIATYAKGPVEIVAVTKNVPFERITQVYELGIRHIGENRVNEALEKFDRLKSWAGFNELKLHFIGHLQSNKIKKVANNFHFVQSIDSIEKAIKLKNLGFKGECFIEINLLGRENRAGIRYEDFYPFLEKLLKNDINVTGIMCMAPLTQDPSTSRIHFSRVRKLFENSKLKWLSMGMSADYIYALMEGANMIRIGTALFNEV